ncbi:DUF4191 domain-containing protein [Georgenia sp. Z1491]|uniref:DUF4191 domain-containing protein n=1 Tax=Georgenia sp. Z1491 TaxID=3416707 RepID=UPI003CEAD812
MARTKKTADDGAPTTPKPKKKRWYHSFAEAYRITAEHRPATPVILLGVFVAVLGVMVGIGFVIGHPIYLGILGVLIGIIAVLIVLGRLTRVAAYARVEGQLGAASAALGQLGRGWYVEEEPVAFTPKHQDLVFRSIGKPGIVLVSEGPPHRVTRLLEEERKKVTRVAPGVQVHLVQAGRAEGQVPLPDLVPTIKKLGGAKLTSAEIAAVTKRLNALGGIRQSVPKGIDPNKARPDRKGMRGR